MNTVDEIKKACQKANLDKTWTWGCECDRTYKDPYTLADVLLAMDKLDDEHLCLSLEGQFMGYYPETADMHLTKVWWNLKEDDLEKQSPETIKFLHNLLKD